MKECVPFHVVTRSPMMLMSMLPPHRRSLATIVAPASIPRALASKMPVFLGAFCHTQRRRRKTKQFGRFHSHGLARKDSRPAHVLRLLVNAR